MGKSVESNDDCKVLIVDLDFDSMTSSVEVVAAGFENAGSRLFNPAQRTLLLNQPAEREAGDRKPDIEKPGDFSSPILQPMNANKAAHLRNSDLGSGSSAGNLKALTPEKNVISIFVTDDLGAEAILHNRPEMLTAPEYKLKSRGITMGRHIFMQYGRVSLTEILGRALSRTRFLMLIE